MQRSQTPLVQIGHLFLNLGVQGVSTYASKGCKVIEDTQSARPKVTGDTGLDPADLIASALRCFGRTRLEMLQDTAYQDTGDDHYKTPTIPTRYLIHNNCLLS